MFIRSRVRAFSQYIWIALISVFFCLKFLLHPGAATAHSLDQSYLYFQIAENTVSARAEVPVQDLNDVLKLGLPEQYSVSAEEVNPHLDTIRTYVERNMEVACEPQTCRLEFRDHDLFDSTAQFLLLNYDLIGFETRPDVLQIKYDPILTDKSNYTNMLLVEQNWETGTFGNEANPFQIFNKPGQSYELDLSSGGLLRGLGAIVKLGIGHILTGIDHVLFLIALLLPSVLRREDGRWKAVESFGPAFIYIVKIATAFTVAHSITLGLAALEIVQFSPRLVESIIAASIGLAAVEIFYPIFRGKVWVMIFIFGLFHGFGFSQILTEIGVTSRHAILSLLGFNLGVEIGQLAIIAIAFPILYLLRNLRLYNSLLLKAGGVALGLISVYWFLERALGTNLSIKGLFGLS